MVSENRKGGILQNLLYEESTTLMSKLDKDIMRKENSSQLYFRINKQKSQTLANQIQHYEKMISWLN